MRETKKTREKKKIRSLLVTDIIKKKVERHSYRSFLCSLSLDYHHHSTLLPAIDSLSFLISISFFEETAIMRITLINTILCLFIALIGIALSSSSSLDNDDYAAVNNDWNDLDSYYPVHLFNTRAAKSRFWKRAPQRKFWKRSLSESAMGNNDMADSAHSQFQQQEKR